MPTDATRNLPGVRTLKVPLFKGVSGFSRRNGGCAWYTVSHGPPTAESLHLRGPTLIHDARYRLRPIQLCRYYTRHMDRASAKNSNKHKGIHTFSSAGSSTNVDSDNGSRCQKVLTGDNVLLLGCQKSAMGAGPWLPQRHDTLGQTRGRPFS